MPVKIAINGFGRIGRLTLRAILAKRKENDLEVVAINDLGDIETISHLLKYDSLYGTLKEEVKIAGDKMIVGEREIKVFSEKEPNNLPWKDLGVDIVLECSGVFRKREDASKHIEVGARKVIISAPGKGGEIPVFVLGVNSHKFNINEDDIFSMASCTTNCLAPLVKVIDEKLGLVKGYMTTVHSYTNDQRILDLSHKDLRRARAAGVNIIPTTTGATKAVEIVYPKAAGKLSGLALRVPTPTVSVVDLVAETEQKISKEELNNFFKEAGNTGELKGILGVEEKPLVSMDFKGDVRSSVVDALATQASGNLVKVLSWYDNEMGYAARLSDFAKLAGENLK